MRFMLMELSQLPEKYIVLAVEDHVYADLHITILKALTYKNIPYLPPITSELR